MTELCKIMKEEGSDKGDSWHNYTLFYSALFDDIKDSIENLFEVGIGTTNPSFQSHMKPEFTPGGSLRGWQRYFQNAHICGADIDRDILFNEERIDCFYIDQTQPAYIEYMWGKDELIDTKFDIIIDDGLHTLPAALCLFDNSFSKLKSDGIYIIEDVQNHMIPQYHDAFDIVAARQEIEYRIISIPHNENKTDNTVIVITRRGSTKYTEKLKAYD